LTNTNETLLKEINIIKNANQDINKNLTDLVNQDKLISKELKNKIAKQSTDLSIEIRNLTTQ